MQNSPKITKEMKKVMIMHKEHTHVFFDVLDNHYYGSIIKNDKGKDEYHGVFLLSKSKDDKEKPKLYGSGDVSHQQLIPGIYNIDERKETLAKGIAQTEIINILTRQQILDAQIEDDSILDLVDNISEQGKITLLSKLGLSPDAIEYLNTINSNKEDKPEKAKK